MNWMEQKIIKLEKMIRYVYCKVKNLTNIHNELDGLQGGQEGEYYHLTESQYNCVIDNCNETCTIGKWYVPKMFEITYTNQSGYNATFKIKNIQEYFNPGETRLIKVDIGNIEEVNILMTQSMFTDFTYTTDGVNGIAGIAQYDNVIQGYTLYVDTSMLSGNGINIHTM